MNFYRKPTHILFIALIIVITFSNSLKSDFAWDDKYLIINNPYIKDFSCLPEIFSSQLYEGSGMKSNFYRPLQLLSFAVDYSIWKLNPFGYHLTNLLLHACNTALIYFIISSVSSSLAIAFLGALMFGVSPVISGVVYYIPARADLLMALLALLSFFLFLKYRETKKRALYFISIVSFMLSILCKEMAVVLPFLLAMEVFMNRGKKIYLKFLYPYFSVLFLYILFRINFTTPANGFSDHGFPEIIPIWKRILTDFNVIVEYVRLLVFPSGLHMQRFIKPAGGLLEINVLFPLALIAFMITAIIRLSRNNKIFSYSALWFFVCLLPVLNIYPVSVFLHEMWLYLPSVGFYMFLSALIVNIVSRRISRAKITAFIVLYIIYYFFANISYGKTWHDSISLFSNDLKYEKASPFRYLLHNNMGMAYYDKGEIEKSIEHYKKSASLNPEYSEAYNNLGVAYGALKRPVKAVFFLKKAVQLRRNYADAYCNLGHIYNNIGSRDMAVEVSAAAIKIDPGSYKAYCNLGYVYSDKGDIDKAIEFFKRAGAIREKDYEAHYCLAALYIKKNNYKEALDESEKALRYGLDNFDFYNTLAFVYIKNNKFKEAEWALKRSLLLNNNQFEPHNNLGNLYTMFGYADLAKKEYEKAAEYAKP